MSTEVSWPCGVGLDSGSVVHLKQICHPREPVAICLLVICGDSAVAKASPTSAVGILGHGVLVG